MCLHDGLGTFLYLSPSALVVLGSAPEGLIGTSPCAVLHPNDGPRLCEEVRTGLAHGAILWVSEYRVRRQSGEYVWVETMAQRVAHVDD